MELYSHQNEQTTQAHDSTTAMVSCCCTRVQHLRNYCRCGIVGL